jgi:GYF domain 2
VVKIGLFCPEKRAMADQAYVKFADRVVGPISLGKLKELAAHGRLSPDVQIRRGPDGEWYRARQIKGLLPFFNNPIETRSLLTVAGHFRRIAIFRGLLWMLAGYPCLILATGSLWAVVVIPWTLLIHPMLTATLLVFAAVSALVCIASAFFYAILADRLSRFRPVTVRLSICMLFLAVAVIPCGIFHLLCLLAIALPGFYCLRQLLRTPVHSGNDCPQQTLADSLRCDSTLESLATPEQRRQQALLITKAFYVGGAKVLGLQLVSGGLTFLILGAGVQVDSPLIPIAQLVLALVSAFTVFVISSGISAQVHDSRTSLAPSLSSARSRDTRNPVLLLRSFSDETSLTREGQLRFVSMTRLTLKSLEENLTDHLWRFGPVVAIGLPGQLAPPIGAAREYLDVAKTRWQDHVQRLMSEADMIVLIAGNSRGLAWESRWVRKSRHHWKLLVVVPPWMRQDAWAEFCARGNIPLRATECSAGETDGDRLLGLRFENGRVVAYRGKADQFGYEALSVVAGMELLNTHR